jgi:hypothetical protein
MGKVELRVRFETRQDESKMVDFEHRSGAYMK